MLREEMVLMYSILSLVGCLVPSLPYNINNKFVVKTLCLIVSIVFYALALSQIKKIKKNVYYKLSIAFLVVTSSIYLYLFLIFIVVLVIGGVGIYRNFRRLVYHNFSGVYNP